MLVVKSNNGKLIIQLEWPNVKLHELDAYSQHIVVIYTYLYM